MKRNKSKGFGPANTKFDAKNLRNGQTVTVDGGPRRRSYEVWAELIEKTEGREGDRYYIKWQRSGFETICSFCMINGVWEVR